ncbi:hypothetical protein Pla52o_42290 [Novipirellula galeiformis]|uniref:Type II secretion system protein G n=1 Tax=Novipirellula galeiformis TaxID=2528004 RepID=A0A5C6CAT4_9BACT|nr:hypothetical protein [Novipirellula galeiformis]TWU21195.1 hypothetical protein Pla52o_42290 [Novipirellula galeiformis]
MFQVVLLLGCLSVAGAAMMALRSWVTERSRVTTAFEYLYEVQHSQQRYFAQTGTYAERLADLDLSIPSPAYFAVGELEIRQRDTTGPAWRMQLNRVGVAPLFGAYEITFDGSGFVASASSVQPWIVPANIGAWQASDPRALAKL